MSILDRPMSSYFRLIPWALALIGALELTAIALVLAGRVDLAAACDAYWFVGLILLPTVTPPVTEPTPGEPKSFADRSWNESTWLQRLQILAALGAIFVIFFARSLFALPVAVLIRAGILGPYLLVSSVRLLRQPTWSVPRQ